MKYHHVQGTVTSRILPLSLCCQVSERKGGTFPASHCGAGGKSKSGCWFCVGPSQSPISGRVCARLSWGEDGRGYEHLVGTCPWEKCRRGPMVRCWRGRDLREEWGLSKLVQRANATGVGTRNSWERVWPLQPHRCPHCYQVLLYQSVSETLGQVLTCFMEGEKNQPRFCCKGTWAAAGNSHTHTLGLETHNAKWNVLYLFLTFHSNTQKVKSIINPYWSPYTRPLHSLPIHIILKQVPDILTGDRYFRRYALKNKVVFLK